MIGWVEFRGGGRLVRAILGDDGLWACPDAPESAALLNRECTPAGDRDQAGDTWGHEAIIEAAQRLQGLAWLGPMRETD